MGCTCVKDGRHKNNDKHNYISSLPINAKTYNGYQSQDNNGYSMKLETSIIIVKQAEKTENLQKSIPATTKVQYETISNLVETNCQKCGKIFKRKLEDNWRKFCNKECLNSFQLEIPLDSNNCVPKSEPSSIDMDCQKCGKIFKRKPEDNWRKFCSKECSQLKDNNSTCKCKHCGKIFNRKPEDNWRSFCSKQCSNLSLVSKICTKCNRKFEVTQVDKWKNLCGRSDCFTKNQQLNNNLSDNDDKILQVKKPFSEKSIIWLENIMAAEKIQIQHAKNSDEYKIEISDGKHIKCDGYCSKTNTVYEFYGDFWHGNPKIFPRTKLNPKTNTTFGYLYDKTMEREKIITLLGYNLITIWEHDFDQL